MLETAYPLLKSTYSWWFKNRDGNGNGVLEYGNSCNGHGHFVGTKLAAKDEAAMDNSPMYDSAAFVSEKHTINMEIFSARWHEERACYENHNTFSGLGGDSVDADPLYGWGALIPLMWVFEHIDIDLEGD